jgi:hypothetical protein
LLNDEILDLEAPILALTGEKIGTLKLKVYWFDAEPKELAKEAGKLTEVIN